MRADQSLRVELLSRVEAARGELMTAIQGLTDEQMTTPALDGWSVKDHLAHIAAWDELRYYEVMRVVRGQPTIYHDMRDMRDDYEVQDINRAATYFRRNLAPDEVLQEMDFTRARILELLETVPEEKLSQAADGRVRIRRAADHDLDHAAQIRAWPETEGI